MNLTHALSSQDQRRDAINQVDPCTPENYHPRESMQQYCSNLKHGLISEIIYILFDVVLVLVGRSTQSEGETILELMVPPSLECRG